MIKLPRKLKKQVKNELLKKNDLVGIWRVDEVRIDAFEKHRHAEKLTTINGKSVTSFRLNS
jgi:hypothetical protein